MMMTLPTFVLTVEIEYNDDLELTGTAEQLKSVIEVLMNNNLTTFNVKPYVPRTQFIGGLGTLAGMA